MIDTLVFPKASLYSRYISTITLIVTVEVNWSIILFVFYKAQKWEKQKQRTRLITCLKTSRGKWRSGRARKTIKSRRLMTLIPQKIGKIVPRVSNHNKTSILLRHIFHLTMWIYFLLKIKTIFNSLFLYFVPLVNSSRLLAKSATMVDQQLYVLIHTVDHMMCMPLGIWRKIRR